MSSLATPQSVTVVVGAPPPPGPQFGDIVISLVSAIDSSGVIVANATYTNIRTDITIPFVARVEYSTGATLVGTNDLAMTLLPGGFQTHPTSLAVPAGTYTVVWNAFDTLGLLAVAQSTVVIIAPPPPVVLSVTATGLPLTGVEPLTVNFSATASGGTTPYTFTWNFGDTTTGTGALVSHTYFGGSYTATVTVTDSLFATSTAQVTITVSETFLAGDITLTLASAISPTFNTVTYSVTITNNHPTLTFSGRVTVDWGAGTPGNSHGQSLLPLQSTIVTGTLLNVPAGTYTIRFGAFIASLGLAFTSVPGVIVLNPPPPPALGNISIEAFQAVPSFTPLAIDHLAGYHNIRTDISINVLRRVEVFNSLGILVNSQQDTVIIPPTQNFSFFGTLVVPAAGTYTVTWTAFEATVLTLLATQSSLVGV